MRFATPVSEQPLEGYRRLSRPSLKPTEYYHPQLLKELSQIDSLTPEEQVDVQIALYVVRHEFEPLMAFEAPFDLQVTTSISAMGEYVHGTSDKPYILLNPVAIHQYAKDYQRSFYVEVLMTLVHELAHVKQDLAGRLDGSEDIESEAELFAYNWVCYDQMSLDLLTPWEESRF